MPAPKDPIKYQIWKKHLQETALQKGFGKWMKGKHNSSKTEFKKGESHSVKGRHWKCSLESSLKKSKYWKDKSRPCMANELHPQWKGDDVGYDALHHWVHRHLGQPEICKVCGITSKEVRLHWANKGHTYKRNSEDWISLCPICHAFYDKANGFKRGRKSNQA